MARKALEWSPEAVEDLEEIAAFIARDNPSAADAWIDKLIARAEKASLAPNAGRMVPEMGTRDVREVFLRTYRIIYRVESHRVVVLTIIEGHRLLKKKP